MRLCSSSTKQNYFFLSIFLLSFWTASKMHYPPFPVLDFFPVNLNISRLKVHLLNCSTIALRRHAIQKINREQRSDKDCCKFWLDLVSMERTEQFVENVKIDKRIGKRIDKRLGKRMDRHLPIQTYRKTYRQTLIYINVHVSVQIDKHIPI